MTERFTEAQFSTQCAFIAKSAAAWAGDILTLPERYNEPASPATVGRFTDEMRERLDRLDARAGRSAPASVESMKITDQMVEAAKKELFGKGFVDTFTIRAALEAALTAVPASAAEPVTRQTIPPSLYADIVAPYTAAMGMIRESIGELFGPTASIESEEAVLLRGPEPYHDAEAIIAALQRIHLTIDT